MRKVRWFDRAWSRLMTRNGLIVTWTVLLLTFAGAVVMGGTQIVAHQAVARSTLQSVQVMI